MTTASGTIRGFSDPNAKDSRSARIGDITLDTPVVSPRGDSYSLARFTTDHISLLNPNDIDPVGGARHVLGIGDRVQFDLRIEPASFDREAYNVKPA